MISWENHYDDMLKAVSKTLEEISFMIVEPTTQNIDLSGLTLASTIDTEIEGELFSITLLVSNDFISMIIDNIYGENSSLSDPEDVLNEINNTICGNFFRNIDSLRDKFKIGIPYNKKSSNEPLISYTFLIEDNHNVMISIYKR